MIDMDPTPAPIEEPTVVIVSYCSDEEKNSRLNFCKSCPKFQLQDERTFCLDNNKNISLIITNSDIVCPLGNW